ncbi:hypothetical protein JIG36_35780 [Actinoplanes sp. LDG1-06]|uniref:HNH/ENDO VII superfamily nuclease with conserved GHE residues n=1 Tax=Paractinoplanes ovalisporus TaxID=2810368 RepID=A0ABS2AM29_9ACTN|nr:GH-E family nuclease [Actinoplanes ovalisporus]MBM2620875.1 hypothetical protein [Actinoplanes ovalisporus]
MARGRGGSGSSPDVDTPAPSPRRRRPGGGNASSVDGGHESVQAAFTAGRVNSGSSPSPAASTRSPVTSTVTGEQLPAGYSYDANGRLHGPDGGYARDPSAPPGAHNRDTEYPGGYRESTHDEMARRYTHEGALAGEWPRMPDGRRMPREDMTWFDENGEEIDVPPGDDITYDHRTPTVVDWNENGRNNDRQYRIDWYNNVDNLRPQLRSENSSAGAQLGVRYEQDTGPGYSP